ncbi:hydrolase [Amycolatopsis mediterranei S699]|uniref:Hydrolase n=2 Tax=Amycolatopsis mediterranei TaxID=33910 RepID=A0A9R0NW07_AMYMS|nr:alpha/beta hydrolase [Amycolatopsis mediterranei]ADJ44891.1 putative hydrolase [Amycolatopsis mediterranei U32]AEK41641.1 hydrolase [Amycolatopsis mediterranei S699]AFO76602.1 hydrolase [Amycolatopsis mediterranei S699]AGT83731.1 hydrolase [Amycolatopsis mediterranei RB]KDO07283.1 hydrolase [Amycolatopsis mediterranei]
MLGTVLASALLLTGATPAVAAPAVAETGWTPAPIVWTPCPDDPDSPTPADGECGTLQVPLDWNSPGGPSISLAVARHRATDPAHRIGVLLADFGGPGSSNAELAATPSVFSPEVRARFDIVGFDVRGTGRSEFIECPVTGEPPGDEPAGPAEFAALRTSSEQAVSACRARNLPVFDHADTGVNARDMDAVRRALGETRISFVGISYGTLLGQQYAEQHGDRLRAMVLDSSVDHSAGIERFLGDRAAAADDAFREFAAWCDRTTTCVLHGQDVFAVWRKALAVTAGTPRAQSELRNWVLADMYHPNWDDLGRAIADTAAGNPPVTAQFTYNYDSIRLAVVCQDFDLRIRNFAQYTTLHAEELRRGPLMRGSTLSHGEAMACLGVHGPPSNPPHRLSIPRAPRILLMNSRHDPATPYAWALAIHHQAPANTTLLTYEGSGHGVHDKNACTRSAMDRYLLTLAAPEHDVSCPA